MQSLFRASCAGLGISLLIAGTAPAEDTPVAFRFNFEANHPLTYSVQSKVTTLTDRTVQLDTGNKSALTKNVVESRYKLRLTPVQKLKDGKWRVHYEPLDFEQDIDITAANGHLVTNIRGLEVKSTQNGIVVVDTSRGVGMTQAKSLKQVVYPKMLSGYFEFQPSGQATPIDGDLPFIDTWKENVKYQVGFFDVTFPTQAVKPGGKWTAVLTMRDLEGLKLGDQGIQETNEFTRGMMPTSAHVESIETTMAVNTRNVMGSMDTMGQNTMLNISEFDHDKTGKFGFDTAAGCMVNGDESETVKMIMDMLVQGHTVSMTMDLQTETKFDLIKN